MSKRRVKSVGAALARTAKPVGDAQPARAARDGLENFVAGLGTDRDKRSFTSYGLPRTLTRQDLENMYRGSWLPKKIVNCVADDMTREWRNVMFDDDNDTKDESQKAFEATERQFAVPSKVNECLRWARLYGGSLLVIGTNDSADPSKPLDVSRLGKGCLRYLHVLDRWRVSAGPLNRDLNSPNLGLPDYYLLAESSVQIHHTRVLRFNGQKLPYFAWMQNAMWDDSELQHVYESLLNCDSTSAGIASMIFEANVDVIKVAQLNELLATRDGEQLLNKRFGLAAMMKSFNRTLLLGGEEEYDKKSNNFAGLKDIMQAFQVDVSGAADIPVTRLFGQSAAGLNATGDGDIRNYYDKVSGEQENQLRPKLEYLDEILCRHTFGAVPDDFRFEFSTLWQMDEVQQSQAELNRAQRDNTYLAAGVITEGMVAAELKERGTYRVMTDEDVELAEELAKPVDGDLPPVQGGQAGQQDPNGPPGNQIAGVEQTGATPEKTPEGQGGAK